MSYHLLVVGTVAGGLGDIAFIANLIRLCYGTRSFTSIALIVCQQAGGDTKASLEALIAQLDESGFPVTTFTVICCTHRVSHGTCGTEFVHFRLSSDPAVKVCSSSPPLTYLPDLVIQGPLILFESRESVLSSLVVPTLHSQREALPRLLTIREFGQGRFCSGQSSSLGLDISAGIDEGEFGIFRIVPPPADSGRTIIPRFVVGYYRSGQHHSCFGRLAASVLLSMRDNADDDAYVFGPWLREELESRRALDAFVEAIAAHPGSEKTSFELCPAITDSKVPIWFPSVCTKVDRSPSERRVSSSFWEPVGTVVVNHHGRRTVIHLVSLPALRLSVTRFRALLAHAEAAIVTGDASLNEAICFSVPFWYSSEPHKASTRAALRRMVVGPSLAALAVSAWWAYIDGQRQTPASGAGAPHLIQTWQTTLWEAFLVATRALRVDNTVHSSQFGSRVADVVHDSELSSVEVAPLPGAMGLGESTGTILGTRTIRDAFSGVFSSSVASVERSGIKYLDDTLSTLF